MPVCVWYDAPKTGDLFRQIGRTLIVFSLLLYYIRLLDIFTVHQVFGPKLIMIGRMIKDVMIIWTMLLVIVVSYGVVTQALMAPNTSTDWSQSGIMELLDRNYWAMFGELGSALKQIGNIQIYLLFKYWKIKIFSTPKLKLSNRPVCI